MNVRPHSLFEDAVGSLEDIEYERVTHSLQLQHAVIGGGHVDMHYVMLNWGKIDHYVVPLAPQEWVRDRFSKRVTGASGEHVPFLGSEFIRDVMAESAVRGFARANRRLGVAVPAKVLGDIRNTIETPRRERDELWPKMAERALEAVSRTITLAEGGNLHDEDLQSGARMAFDCVVLASQNHYFPLVLLSAPVRPQGADDSRDTRQLVTQRLLPKPEPHEWSTVPAQQKLRLLVADLFARRHEQVVTFHASVLARSNHMEIHAPQGMEMLRPRWPPEEPTVAEKDWPDWETKTSNSYKFVRRWSHVEDRQDKELTRVGTDPATALSDPPGLLSYTLTTRYKEPGPVYAISVMACLLLGLVGFLLGTNLLPIGDAVLALLGFVLAIWLARHEPAIGAALSRRFGAGFLLGLAAFVAGAATRVVIRVLWGVGLVPWP